jgi:periplasmic protein TonB
MKHGLIGLFLLFSFSLSSQVQDADTTIYTIVDEQAEFPGGISELQNFFKKNLVYPQSCIDAGSTGSVYFRFVVDKQGYIVKPEVLRYNKYCPEIEKEVLRVLAFLPNWKPAKMNGVPVNCYYQLPMKLCPIK